MQLDQLLIAREYMAVVETIKEEIEACEVVACELGDEPERAELLRSALKKIAPEAT